MVSSRMRSPEILDFRVVYTLAIHQIYFDSDNSRLIIRTVFYSVDNR